MRYTALFADPSAGVRSSPTRIHPDVHDSRPPRGTASFRARTVLAIGRDHNGATITV